MAHLESKQIVHRDLAARNVLGMCCDATLLSFTLSFTRVSHHLMLSYNRSTFVNNCSHIYSILLFAVTAYIPSASASVPGASDKLSE